MTVFWQKIKNVKGEWKILNGFHICSGGPSNPNKAQMQHMWGTRGRQKSKLMQQMAQKSFHSRIYWQSSGWSSVWEPISNTCCTKHRSDYSFTLDVNTFKSWCFNCELYSPTYWKCCIYVVDLNYTLLKFISCWGMLNLRQLDSLNIHNKLLLYCYCECDPMLKHVCLSWKKMIKCVS